MECITIHFTEKLELITCKAGTHTSSSDKVHTLQYYIM